MVPLQEKELQQEKENNNKKKGFKQDRDKIKVTHKDICGHSS